MQIKKFFATWLFIILAISSSCNLTKPTKPIVGIDEALVIEDTTFRVVEVQIRKSYSVHYIMEYPPSGFVFCEIITEIGGFDRPEAALEWAKANIRVIQKNQVMVVEYATWFLVGDQIVYAVDTDFRYQYHLFYLLPDPPDPASLYLYLLSDHLISLAPMMEATDAQTGRTGKDQNNLDKTASTSSELPPSDQSGWIGGGTGNSASSYQTVVAGGYQNTASSAYASITGGRENLADGLYSTIAGGYANQATGRDSFVGGGSRNMAQNYHATIAGGIRNQALGTDTTISGGSYNTAGDLYATIGGGTQNQALGSGAVISGGAGNIAQSDQSVISGGLANKTSGSYSVIGGGQGNNISGNFSIIPGGIGNIVSANFALAAGNQAVVKENHPGAFVYADSLNLEFTSQAANEFAVRSTGGVRFVTGVDPSGSPISGAILPSGSGSWANLSDRDSKENLHPVDSTIILQNLASIPITSWNYKAQEDQIKHMGPMAQDFYIAFGLGENDKTISSVDADGIALAAIQGLYQQDIIQEQQLENFRNQLSFIKFLLIVENILLIGSCLILISRKWYINKT